MNTLRKQTRRSMNREEEPSAAVIDSQSIKTRAVRGSERGFDAGEKIWGRKRQLLVDTQGFVLAVNVHNAGISDQEGAKVLLGEVQGSFPRISRLLADHGSTGSLRNWIKERLNWDTEIVPQEGNQSRYN